MLLFVSEFYDEDDIPSLYPHATGILYALKDRGIELAIASRSPASNVAKTFLSKLGIDSLFVVQVGGAIVSCLISYMCFLSMSEY